MVENLKIQIVEPINQETKQQWINVGIGCHEIQWLTDAICAFRFGKVRVNFNSKIINSNGRSEWTHGSDAFKWYQIQLIGNYRDVDGYQ